ncbi:hypothetical protein OF83DRAFT_438574 [Amylostereum chailletii]|nr:hypothetical protein OF83DRAFT_438574 [Amylostereum chailletii]
MISKSNAMWDSMWNQRNSINRRDPFADSDEKFRTDIAYLLAQFGDLYQSWNRVPATPDTRLNHLTIFLWYNTPVGEQRSYALNAAIWYATNEMNGFTVMRIVKESAIDVFGGKELLERFHRDLDDPTLVNKDLSTCLQAMNLFVFHSAVRPYMGPLASYKHIFEALNRQTTKGEREHDFNIFSRASPLLCWSSSDFPPSMCLSPMLERHDLVCVMARGAILCAENNCGPINTNACVCLIEDHGKLLGSPNLPAGKNRWTHLVKAATRRDWYPTLQRLRELRPQNGPVPHMYTRLLRAWEQFGERARVDEAAERVRFERIEAKKAKWCAWKQCEYHEKEPATPMLKCSGCHKVRYCDKACQRRDWKEGGHKRRCLSQDT